MWEIDVYFPFFYCVSLLLFCCECKLNTSSMCFMLQALELLRGCDPFCSLEDFSCETSAGKCRVSLKAALHWELTAQYKWSETKFNFSVEKEELTQSSWVVSMAWLCCCAEGIVHRAGFALWATNITTPVIFPYYLRHWIRFFQLCHRRLIHSTIVSAMEETLISNSTKWGFQCFMDKEMHQITSLAWLEWV